MLLPPALRRAAPLAALLAAVFVGCAQPKRVSLAEGPREYIPFDYDEILRRWTRSGSLVALAELDDLLTITATFESWDFRWAYTVRYADDYRLTVEQRQKLLESSLAEARAEHRFYIALYGPHRRWNDLSKKDAAWVVRLIDDKGNETPTQVVTSIARPGALERTYFPYTNVWRQAFRLVFPTHRPDGGPTIAPDARWFGLRFAGAQGHHDLVWQLLTRPAAPTSPRKRAAVRADAGKLGGVTKGPKIAELATSRLGRLASLARAGIGTASSVALGSIGGVERAVERLGEMRGIGTKVGQMAGLVEATLTPEMRARVGPALAKLRAEAACSPYEAVAAIVREDLGAPPEELFARFDAAPFASASLGQVHRATHHDGRELAVKIQHPGIDVAFAGDLANVTSLGRVATSFMMPDGQGATFIDGVKNGFLAELDYVREADNLRTFAGLVAHDDQLETPEVADDRSSRRVLSTTFLRGVPVEAARAFDEALRLRLAAAVRRFVISSLTDHGVLYADAHAGNFLFRDDGTVGVLDFGSTFRFDDEARAGFAALRRAAAEDDRGAFGRAIADVYRIHEPRVAEAIADVQWLGLGGLVRGDRIDVDHVRSIATRAGEMKRKLLGTRFTLPSFLPFFVRTLVATNSLMASLDAPRGEVVGTLPGPRTEDAR